MSEENRSPFQILQSRSVIADILSKRTPLILPSSIYEWAVGWVSEIGSTMRSRNFIATNIAYGLLTITKMAIMPGMLGQKTQKKG